MTTVNVPEEIGAVVEATRIRLATLRDDNNNVLFPELNYMWGHSKEVTQRLQEMTDAPSLKNHKFPVIILFTDIPVQRNNPLGYYGNTKLNLVIATLSEQNLTAPQRLEKNFKPILYPIKEEFYRQLMRHRGFSFEARPIFTEIDRYFWGKDGLYGVQGNITNDYVDCIEIQGLLVNIQNSICSRPNNF